ncbi:ABC transporter substrate-binding protein [Microbacterium sediminicola]|uniref:ABC transporter substrate-binding protein n=1 Tax=Microbacterium sediminicola TaxID=415210 RepID=A0ABP4UCU6_9MICO
MAGIHLPKSRRSRVALTSLAILSTAALLSACTGTSEPADTATADTGVVDAELAALVPAEIADSGVLSLGALWETPPMISVDEADTNVAVGIAPDLAAIVAPILGLEPEWQNMQWPAQLPGVLSGVVDALWGQVTDTAEREASEYDQIPFFKNTESLLVLSENADGIDGLASMCGLSVGVPVGSTQSEEVASVSAEYCEANGEPAIELAEYQGATAAISAVQAGTVDAWMDNTTSQYGAADASDGLFSVVLITEVPETFTAITVSKEYPGLSEALAGALRISIEDGSYQAVLDEWGVGAAAVTVDEVVINPYTGIAPGESE